MREDCACAASKKSVKKTVKSIATLACSKSLPDLFSKTHQELLNAHRNLIPPNSSTSFPAPLDYLGLIS